MTVEFRVSVIVATRIVIVEAAGCETPISAKDGMLIPQEQKGTNEKPTPNNVGLPRDIPTVARGTSHGRRGCLYGPILRMRPTENWHHCTPNVINIGDDSMIGMTFVSWNVAMAPAPNPRLDTWNDPLTVDAAPWMIYIPCVRGAPVDVVLTHVVIPPRLVIVPKVENVR